MTIYIFPKGGKDIPSSRYRAYFLADELNRLGCKAEIYPLGLDWKECNSFLNNLRSFFKYLKFLLSREKSDVIFLQRTIYNKYFFAAVLTAKLFFGRNFVFDFDDAIFVHSFFKTLLLTKLAKVVTCGGYFVLDWAKKHNKNSFYLPDGLPAEDYFSFAKKNREENNPPVIGWLGDGPIHLENLKFFRKVLERLDEEGLKFKFKLVGAKKTPDIYNLFDNFPKEKIEIIDWVEPEKVPAAIQGFDIGVMPLLDTPWNRAKYIKTLEYMACAVPPVVSGVGENRFIVKHGENGFMAETIEEWMGRLGLLLTNQDLREKLGKAGQLTVKENFSLTKIAQELIKILKEKW